MVLFRTDLDDILPEAWHIRHVRLACAAVSTSAGICLESICLITPFHTLAHTGAACLA